MTSFNSITGRGVSTPSADVGSAGGPELDPDEPTDSSGPLGPGTPQSIDFIEPPPPPQSLAFPPLGGETVSVGGAGGGSPAVRPQSPPQVAPEAGAPPRQPAPPIVTGLNLGMGDPKVKLDPMIEKLINESPHLKELWEKARQKGFEIRLIEGNESWTNKDSKPPTIFIGRDSVKWDGPPDHMARKFATLLAHEIGHAANPSPPIQDLRSRSAHVEHNLGPAIKNEAEAYFANAQVRHEIRGSDGTGPDIGIRGKYDNEINDIYNRYLAGDLTKEQAIEEMGYWAELEPRRHADGSEGTTEEVYRRQLENDWDEKHKT